MDPDRCQAKLMSSGELLLFNSGMVLFVGRPIELRASMIRRCTGGRRFTAIMFTSRRLKRVAERGVTAWMADFPFTNITNMFRRYSTYGRPRVSPTGWSPGL